MKGLLLKDFALMKGQRRFFLMLLLIGMIPALAGGNVGFLTVYLPFGFCFFTISTISYDEIDNSLPFLLILPVSRREYRRKICVRHNLWSWNFGVMPAFGYRIWHIP